MPEISRFLGIVIAIFYKDHAPAHFHAKYGEYSAAFSIDDLAIIKGNLPPRVLALVMEWAMMHKEELMVDWKLAQEGKPLTKIAPLV